MPRAHEPVTAQYNARATVLLGKVVKHPHDPDLKLHPGVLDRVKGIVPVQCLSRLARQKFDRRHAANLVGRTMRQ